MTLTDMFCGARLSDAAVPAVPAGEVGPSSCAVPQGARGGNTTPARQEPDRSPTGGPQQSGGAQAAAVAADGWCEHGGDADVCPPCHQRYPIVADPLPRRAVVTHRPGRVEPAQCGDRITPTERGVAGPGHELFDVEAVGC